MWKIESSKKRRRKEEEGRVGRWETEENEKASVILFKKILTQILQNEILVSRVWLSLTFPHGAEKVATKPDPKHACSKVKPSVTRPVKRGISDLVLLTTSWQGGKTTVSASHAPPVRVPVRCLPIENKHISLQPFPPTSKFLCAGWILYITCSLQKSIQYTGLLFVLILKVPWWSLGCFGCKEQAHTFTLLECWIF